MSPGAKHVRERKSTRARRTLARVEYEIRELAKTITSADHLEEVLLALSEDSEQRDVLRKLVEPHLKFAQ